MIIEWLAIKRADSTIKYIIPKLSKQTIKRKTESEMLVTFSYLSFLSQIQVLLFENVSVNLY